MNLGMNPEVIMSKILSLWKPKVTWYFPCIKFSSGGASGGGVGGVKRWGLGWVCEKVFRG